MIFKLWYFDRKLSLKAYDLLLFPEKRLNLILGVVHESHAGPVLCYLQKAIPKSLTIFFPEQLPSQHYNSSKF